jgi:membrane-associated phospholipid phosphatase
MKRRFWPIGIAIVYLLLIYYLGGLRADHVEIALLCLLDSINQKTRNFLKYFFPFILTAVVFDFMRYFYWPGVEGHIYVREPYFRDLKWFGINVGDGVALKRVTPNEFFEIHHWPALDLLCGFAYIVFISETLILGIYYFLKEKFNILAALSWSFFTVNMLGFATYFIYPSAPPWYITKYGLGPARMDARPDSAAAKRFDEILGTHVFKEMYGRGVDVYGAYPSLHVAYPLMVAWFIFYKSDLKWARIPSVLFYLLMCLSAVYLQHHYIEDILLGSVYAIVVLSGANYFLRKKEESLVLTKKAYEV